MWFTASSSNTVALLELHAVSAFEVTSATMKNVDTDDTGTSSVAAAVNLE